MRSDLDNNKSAAKQLSILVEANTAIDAVGVQWESTLRDAMAQFKNQHFVPKCLLRQFSADNRHRSLNVFNIRTERLIPTAPLKNQASRNYMYGKDLELEHRLACIEGAFDVVLKQVAGGEGVAEDELEQVRFFMFLQLRRTEMAVKRLKHAYDSMEAKVFGDEAEAPTPPTFYELTMDSLRLCLQSLNSVEDLKFRLIHNESRTDFVISDDPVVFANRYATQRLGSPGFGVNSSGLMLLMPLTPRRAAICYDNQVYTAPDLSNGRIVIRRDDDASAINEFQFLKGAENIYFQDWNARQSVADEYARCKNQRRDDWSKVTVLVPDDAGKDGAIREKDGKLQNYRIGTREEGKAIGKALLRMSFTYPTPTRWFSQLKYRSKPKTFYNGTGVGHVRKEEWLRTRRASV